MLSLNGFLGRNCNKKKQKKKKKNKKKKKKQQQKNKKKKQFFFSIMPKRVKSSYIRSKIHLFLDFALTFIDKLLVFRCGLVGFLLLVIWLRFITRKSWLEFPPLKRRVEINRDGMLSVTTENQAVVIGAFKPIRCVGSSFVALVLTLFVPHLSFVWCLVNPPLNPSSMARVLVYPSLDSLHAVDGTRDQQRLWSDCVNTQTGMSLRWSHKS